MAIITYIQGGLGNQMFQYAAGRALSVRYGVPLILEKSWFDSTPKGSTPREFQLPLFRLQASTQIKSNNRLPKGKLGRILQKITPLKPHTIRESKGFQFDPRTLMLENNVNSDIHMIGYWQSYKYINEIRPILQEEFQTKVPLSNQYADYLEQIRLADSTMLHIRRGDYVHLPSANEYHKPLEIEYYLKAIDEMLLKNPTSHFFVFSDDLGWAKAMLPKTLNITYIENINGPDAAAQELQLMTNCKNHIIANSSLSWWGAWLKKDTSGMVFAPNRWIRDKTLNLSDLLPKEWIQLQAE
jgi:hypothetical protein